MQALLTIDFLGFNHRAVNLMYLETIVRYLPYFLPIPGFILRISQVYLSDKALRSPNQLAASKSAYLFVRLCERIVNMGVKKEE